MEPTAGRIVHYFEPPGPRFGVKIDAVVPGASDGESYPLARRPAIVNKVGPGGMLELTVFTAAGPSIRTDVAETEIPYAGCWMWPHRQPEAKLAEEPDEAPQTEAERMVGDALDLSPDALKRAAEPAAPAGEPLPGPEGVGTETAPDALGERATEDAQDPPAPEAAPGS